MERLTRADELKEGDMVDLQGDPYADPKNDPILAFAFEYAVVSSRTLDAPGLIAIGFEGYAVIPFPVGHMLRVTRRAVA